MRILMSGGGTAGHVYPALSVAAQFAVAPDEVVFVGTPEGVEARLVPAAGVSFAGLSARGFDRARPWTLLTSTARSAVSTAVAWGWMVRRRPDVVVGFGGYVSIPVGLAAVLRGIPLVLHEQNSVPGLANRFLSRWAKHVAVTYAGSARLFRHPDRVTVTGNPVRSAVLESTRDRGRSALGLSDDALVLLVFGGSRGARHLNSALVDLGQRLLALPMIEVLHVTGSAEISRVREMLGGLKADEAAHWRAIDYLDDMGSALAAADVVVARAGATSIAEITALGVPAVLIPYPFATDDHQTKNAEALGASGAAVIVSDAGLDSQRFEDALMGLLTDPDKRATMSAASRTFGRPDAAGRVAQIIRTAAGTGAGGGATRSDLTEDFRA